MLKHQNMYVRFAAMFLKEKLCLQILFVQYVVKVLRVLENFKNDCKYLFLMLMPVHMEEGFRRLLFLVGVGIFILFLDIGLRKYMGLYFLI